MKKLIVNIKYILPIITIFFISCKKDPEIITESENETTTGNIQERLDNGETPFEIYQSDNSLLNSLFGKTYQGGLIAHLNTSAGGGLISATTDLNLAPWGCGPSTNYGSYINGAAGLVYGTGKENTNDILNDCSDLNSAADKCYKYSNSGYTDWFLPSKDELNYLYENLHKNNLGDFSNSMRYWSSSEYEYIESNNVFSFAHEQSFSTGQQYENGPKDFRGNVRPVRYF